MRAFMNNSSVRKGGPLAGLLAYFLLGRNQYIAPRSYCTYNLRTLHSHKSGVIRCGKVGVIEATRAEVEVLAVKLSGWAQT